MEKNAELPVGHPNRKYKGRVVFLGNRVANQDFEGATFAELGNAPANLESGRFADAYGCSRGNASQYADAIQAYLQTKMTGDKCWIELPHEARPGDLGPQNVNKKELNKMIAMFRACYHPMVEMGLALYGHCLLYTSPSPRDS